MGCDIHSFTEKRNKENNKWEIVEDSNPFDWRSYSVFAFIADVRNYDHCEPISLPKGLPDDSEFLNTETDDGWGGTETEKKRIEEMDYHSKSYLTLKELLDFDYNKTFWNRRIYKETYRADGSVSGGNGACLAEEGEGQIISYRENLGTGFFSDLEKLKTFGEPYDVRVIFYFDN